MFLSIVVPVYNAELYLEECLHSLFTQDLPQTDYEVICVDDGSTDKSGFILRSFSEKHQNLTIITQENSGVATARNTGLSAARGDYIWFVDADDVIQTNILRKLRGILEPADGSGASGKPAGQCPRPRSRGLAQSHPQKLPFCPSGQFPASGTDPRRGRAVHV